MLAACASGDRSALKTLLDAEGGRMLGVARRMLRRSDLAEDAVQDALVLIWRRAAQFDPGRGSARGWIYTILRNRCLTMLRQEAREVSTDAADLDTTPLPEVLAQAHGGLEDATGLRQCLDRLDAPTRDAILASYVMGHSHGEIAGRLDSPLGTVKARMRRGLIKLRECLS
ncbi:sigma-70 family RNA polymerase sigma factor [Mangrovicoccus algicola]|uniref:Sigma-70 family RNA polymerase sigma factor n=1 Tax=Mangrovicoccus algicola TaxID=2771008 RepID=A0A8J6YWC3_9RHOB|nr:sigma-70 family RNA polymerase sigma factor [Mangrovicoccus algicola]MBE3637444.1 sigma-70 family RNA polymerase sigma factor [Mangrovicoccus algicola]